MIVQNSILEAPSASQITDLSSKLQQLRRLRVQSDGPEVSCHLNSAMQAVEHAPANRTKLDPGIFIGIIINSNQPAASA